MAMSPTCDRGGCEQPAAWRWMTDGLAEWLCEQHAAPLVSGGVPGLWMRLEQWRAWMGLHETR